MTLGGQPQKAHTQCCCVRWRRVGLHGMKPTKLIGLDELMLIDPLLHLKVLKVAKNQEIRNIPFHVDTTRKTPVHIKVTMKLGGGYTYTYVPIVILKEKMWHIHLKTVGKQKTSEALQKCSAKGK